MNQGEDERQDGGETEQRKRKNVRYVRVCDVRSEAQRTHGNDVKVCLCGPTRNSVVHGHVRGTYECGGATS